jgi:hypothetical protein
MLDFFSELSHVTAREESVNLHITYHNMTILYCHDKSS